jgi:hypothetical protein
VLLALGGLPRLGVGLDSLLLLAVQRLDRDLAQVFLLPLSPRGADRLPGGDPKPGHEGGCHRCRGSKRELVPPNQFLKPIRRARGPGEDGFVIEVSLDVTREAVGRFVPPGAIFLQALHHDPVHIAAQQVNELLDL